MKLSIVFIAAIGLMNVFTSCQTVDSFTQFDMDYQQSVTIESNSSVDLPFNVISPKIETDSESTFAVHDTRKDLIEEIKITSLILTVKSPSNADFSFLESIAVYISASDLPETKVAWDENVTVDGNVLKLSVTTEDLKDFIKADEFVIRLNTQTDEIMTQDHEIEIDATFYVDAKLINKK